MSDPLVAVVRAVADGLERGEAVTVSSVATRVGLSWSTCQRLMAAARGRGWLGEDGVPTLEGLVACGRV